MSCILIHQKKEPKLKTQNLWMSQRFTDLSNIIRQAEHLLPTFPPPLSSLHQPGLHTLGPFALGFFSCLSASFASNGDNSMTV